MRSDLFVLFLPGFVFQNLKQAASGVRCRGSSMIRFSFDACTYSSGNPGNVCYEMSCLQLTSRFKNT